MQFPEPAAAAEQFRALALRTLGDPPIPVGARGDWAATLTDEQGARPASAVPLLYRLAGLAPCAGALVGPDGALWQALHDTGPDPLSLVRTGAGPLTERAETGIEVWTQTELAALHALGAHAATGDTPALWTRLWSAADWHLRELQPDNATCRPWAAHVFVLRALWCDDAEVAAGAGLHASTLLHNCRVSMGRPDRISACILLDAAATLDRVAGLGGPR